MASRKVKPKKPAKRKCAECVRLLGLLVTSEHETEFENKNFMDAHNAWMETTRQLEAVRNLYSAATDRNVSLIRALQQILADSPADLQGNRFAVPAAKIRELIA